MHVVRNTVKKSVGSVIVGIGVIGLVGACSDSGSAVKADGAAAVSDSSDSPEGPSSTAPADASKVHGLVLDASEFPIGYTAQEIPRGQTQQMVDRLLETTKNAKMKPAGCVQLSAVPDSVDINKIGLVVATKGTTTTLTESLAVVPTTIAEYRRQATGKCADMTMTMTMNGQKITSRVKQKVVDGPNTAAADSLVLEMETEATVDSTTVTTRGLFGYASVEGYLVSVQAMNLTPSAKPDRSGFDTVFTKAVAKVADEA
jgi:hypothetical protein